MKTEIESKQLLARYGIATTNPMLATSAKAATDAVRRLGKACALKVVSPDIVHKVDAGGVRLSVQAEQAADAYQAIMDACRHSHPDAAIDGVLIEEMVPPGLEVFIGAQVDRDYGVVVLVGPGGSGVEQRARPKAALAPLDKELALLLVDAAFPDKFAENAAGRETLARYLMAVAGPEGLMMREAVDELDINPVIVSGETAIAVDAVAGEASGARPVAPRSEKDIAEALARRRARLGGLGAIFDPKAIAFVGASTSKDKLGFQLIQTLVDFGFTGKIYPVHPTAQEIYGLKAYPSVADIPGEVDRAYVAVANKLVPQVLAQCQDKGIKVAQVLTAGFSEYSSDSSDLERQMCDQLASGTMRMIGPNCIGTFSSNTRMAIGAPRYNPTEPGGITFFSQSGTYAGDVVRRAQVWGLPVARALSCGNCADLDMLDLLLFAEADPHTTIVAFYIESMRDPGLFFAPRDPSPSRSLSFVAV